ncbi:MAG: carboxymuconolactone decarboxylase family protein [Vagococcus sp.]
MNASNDLATLSEAYKNMYYGLLNMPTLVLGKKKGLLSKHFNSRLMLAVTEVNGCNLCSYGHTTLALDSGMSRVEINQLLGGGMEGIPEAEQAGILFAQHVADNRGAVSKKAWDHLVYLYGQKQAKSILASVQVITMGNTFGIPIGSLFSRISKKAIFKKDARTTLAYEWCLFIAVIVFLPIAISHSLIAQLLSFDKASFK